MTEWCFCENGWDLHERKPTCARPPRKASAAEEARFTAAFNMLLAENPDRPPGPRALATLMGWSNRQLNGRTSKLRRRLLLKAGFRRSDRWYR